MRAACHANEISKIAGQGVGDTLNAPRHRESARAGVRGPQAGPQGGPYACCPRALILLAATLTLLVTGMAASAARLVVTPDSAAYIDLAIGIVERGDFSDDRFQFYTPGYPLLLAAVFSLFGSSSGDALLLLQHAMVVGCAMLATWLAWLIRPSRWFALATAICCASGVHLSGYANAVLTEVPYALLLTACLLTLVWHLRSGGAITLPAASALAGLATWFRPTGQLLVLACVAVGLTRMAGETGGLAGLRRYPRRMLARLAAAAAPAVVLALAIMLNNWRTQGVFDLTCNDDMSLYVRAFAVEQLPLPDNEAAQSIRSALDAQARPGGGIGADNYQRPWAVIGACREHIGLSFPQVGRLMRAAAIPALQSRPATISWNTFVYSYRNLMTPDNMYRMLPEVPPSWQGASASPPASDTHRAFVADRVGVDRLRRYLELRDDPTPTTPLWSGMTASHDDFLERGPFRLGLLDTPHEELTLLALIGFAWLVALRQGAIATLLVFVVGYHVVLSSFFGGVEPRYIIPLHPLLNVLTAAGVIALPGAAVRLAGLACRHLAPLTGQPGGEVHRLQPQ